MEKKRKKIGNYKPKEENKQKLELFLKKIEYGK
jgi:hypothetical protein